MAWIQLHITTTVDTTDQLEDQLLSFGAQALTMNDAGHKPIYEPQLNQAPELWPETTIVALFDDQQDICPALNFLKELQKTQPGLRFHSEILADQDWERRCLEGLKPMRFGERLWICPTWEEPVDPQAINIFLDPGLAFGTGTHPTTSLCLEWLDHHIKGGEKIIDYGCGSGILALAALKLGAKSAVAVDHDSQALKTTIENAQQNKISSSDYATFLPDEAFPYPADILIANILATPLIELASKFANFVRPGGQIILSGILEEQIEEVEKAYNQWFLLEKPAIQAEWVCLSGVRK